MGCVKLFYFYIILEIQNILCLQQNFLSDTYDMINVTELRIPWKFNATIPSNGFKNFNFTVPPEAVFTLVQIHSYLYNISVEYNNGSSETGTNNGFIIFPGLFDKFKVSNDNRFSLDIIGFITAYDKDSPIPGSNLPLNETINPEVKLDLDTNLINITIAPSLMVDPQNETCYNNLTYKLLYMYSPEKDYSKESYFEGIRTMVLQGSNLSDYMGYSITRINVSNDSIINYKFATYAGTGIFFTVVVYNENKSAVYSVAHTFGCDYPKDMDSCTYLVSTWQRVEICILGAVGIILGFCGYDWKSLELSVMSLLVIGIPVYTTLYDSYSLDENLLISLVSGLSVGCLAVLCKRFTFCIFIYHFTSFITCSFLVSSIIMFFSGTGTSEVFKSSEKYWLAFMGIVLIVYTLLFTMKEFSHHATTSFIGTFLAILLVDFFAGSSLKFLVFDNIRRLCVDDFIFSTINPPFQTPEIIMFVLWMTAVFACLAFKCGGYNLPCTQQTQQVLQNDHLSSSEESIDNQNEPGYSTFSDSAPLVTDPRQDDSLSNPSD